MDGRLMFDASVASFAGATRSGSANLHSAISENSGHDAGLKYDPVNGAKIITALATIAR